MNTAIRVAAFCGLALIGFQASASAQYSQRPFGNNNEWHKRSQAAGRGEISKRALHQWMYEDLNPSRPNARLRAPLPVVPVYPQHYRYRHFNGPSIYPGRRIVNPFLVPARRAGKPVGAVPSGGSGGRPR